MSKNNTIRKSDKKFIRKEKARIRRQFLDVKKQEELIGELYKRFLGKPEVTATKEVKTEVKKEVKKEEKPKQGKEKVAKKVKAK